VPEPGKPKMSGWDKFKNFFAGIYNTVGGGLGLPKAHIITDNDYVKNEKTGRD